MDIKWVVVPSICRGLTEQNVLDKCGVIWVNVLVCLLHRDFLLMVHGVNGGRGVIALEHVEEVEFLNLYNSIQKFNRNPKVISGL